MLAKLEAFGIIDHVSAESEETRKHVTQVVTQVVNDAKQEIIGAIMGERGKFSTASSSDGPVVSAAVSNTAQVPGLLLSQSRGIANSPTPP